MILHKQMLVVDILHPFVARDVSNTFADKQLLPKNVSLLCYHSIDNGKASQQVPSNSHISRGPPHSLRSIIGQWHAPPEYCPSSLISKLTNS